jgi:hypothetical protein
MTEKYLVRGPLQPLERPWSKVFHPGDDHEKPDQERTTAMQKSPTTDTTKLSAAGIKILACFASGASRPSSLPDDPWNVLTV